MAGVDVNALTMEQYLALSRENQAPGMVKPEIKGNANFEIKSRFMRELREDTFSENKDEDAHDHIDRVLSIIGLFNILGVTKDAVMLRVFPFTLTGAAKRWLEDIHNFKQEGDESLYQACERYNNLLYKCPTHDINSHQKVRCQICEGPHLDKDCPLNEEVKQVEEVRYGEFGRTAPFNESNGGNFRVGPPGYYTKIDNRSPYAERRQSLEELLAKHQEESAQRSTEMEIEQLTEELRSRKEKSEQEKVVTVENEGPSSSKELKNLHGISFLSDSQEENTID
ncbi:hypothetical protein Tco_0151600 [Tanacetum coccineum]